MSNSIRKTWRRYRTLAGFPRELATLLLMLLVALTLLPLAIWGAGQLFLGDYLRDPAGSRTGGPLTLLGDYVGGIVAGSPGHWFVLLGPYVLLMAFRAARALSKM